MKEFDSLWAQECINDLFDTGCEDDKLALIQLGTENVQVEIKTSGGTTERTNISNIIMQRSASGGLLCTTSIVNSHSYPTDVRLFCTGTREWTHRLI